ncbi:dihydrolipoyl dehydrogenase [Buchnera aphidicola (Thelaxes californica)]|uniref:Dihydrolipoyl dehydrogenase n=1 Tax=Buchnera aphidicola (Thelaxes californica) TaxID=1315998 RepID=A0A4D6YJM2_9GAMM|nr:dihydrolipoyl dehydrogenase [Buchnera aphidicola]QCI26711.1 dihydrolipoyl dehydrogenase [Buchnera aphidicola (Thelaxes californica)]
MKKKINTTVLIIGGGPAGYSAAFRSSDLGLDVVIIEKHKNLGGVCLNAGCIPSKYLLHLSKIISDSKKIFNFGISFNSPNIDLKKISSFKEKMINNLNNGLVHLTKNKKIKHIQGVATFLNKNNVEVTTKSGGIYNIFFDNVIIATGSEPVEIQYSGLKTKKLWNSTDALVFRKIPEKLLIMGAGAIGLEMATVYSAFGSEVDIIDTKKELFPTLDNCFSKIFIKSTEKDFRINLNTTIDSLKEHHEKFSVCIKDNNNNIQLHLYDAIITSIGRKPNFSSLNINNAEIQLNEQGFICVNSQLQTNIPHIYAIGDVVGPPMLAHKSIHEGKIAAEVIFGLKRYFNPSAIPNVIYSNPEIAWTGITTVNHQDNDIKNEVYVSNYSWNSLGKALATGSENGLTQLLFQKSTGRIIGGIIIGNNAGELINEVTLAIEMGCTAEDLSLTIHAHPTLSESVGFASDMFEFFN